MFTDFLIISFKIKQVLGTIQYLVILWYTYNIKIQCIHTVKMKIKLRIHTYNNNIMINHTSNVTTTFIFF